MTQLKKNTTHEMTIENYTTDGAGIARLDGLVVFIPETIRGERWEVLLLKVNKSVAWGKAVRLIEGSCERVEADCPYAGKCGGCQYRHMTYQEELFAKGQRVSDALTRMGGVTTEMPPVLGAVDPTRYRNKVQFPIGGTDNAPSIGFYRPRSHDVVNVEDCLLQPESASKISHVVKNWMLRYGAPIYQERDCSGIMRHLFIRTNQKGEVLCCLVVNRDKVTHLRELIGSIQRVEPQLVGLVLNINNKDTNVILGRKHRLVWGQDYLEETLCGKTFKLSVPSFFQINQPQTEVLYGKVMEFAELTGEETVVDLYCGIGTISLCLAEKAKKVVGVEIVEQAIEDAQANADRNGVENIDFYCGDAGEIATQLKAEEIHPDVVVLDPPRKGLAPEVAEIVAGMAPARIVYVSCDPATLARDVKKFTELGYQFVKGQAVDMFPRTAHVETVILMTRA